MKTSFWSRFLDLVSPRQCVICGKRLSISERSICSACYLHLPRTTFQFAPYDNPLAHLFWGLSPVSRAAALFYYEPHSDEAQVIYDLKYGNRPDIGEDLGRMMAEEFMMAGYFDGVDALLPVPLSSKRMRQRGYNQSERICYGIQAQTGLPILTQVLHRLYFHQSQTTLMRHQRQANVSGMFELDAQAGLEGKHILLVDDICTTGSTLIACANVLSEIPRVRISILTLGFTKS